MTFAIPVVRGKMTDHIHACEAYALVDVDEAEHCVTSVSYRVAPPLAPSDLPDWLVKMGAQTLIAWGMTNRLQRLCEYHGLQVVLGAEPGPPEQLALKYSNGAAARA